MPIPSRLCSLLSVACRGPRLPALVLGLVLAGCASAPAVPAGERAAGPDPDQVDVVVFRPPGGLERPVNVYVDHAYVASLMPAGFARLRTCSGSVEVTVASDDSRRQHRMRLVPGEVLDLRPGELRYWRLSPPAAEPGFWRLVASNRSEFEREATRRPSRSLSRLAPTCEAQRQRGRAALDSLARPD